MQRSMIYISGVVGGGHYTEKGNGANYLCLATDPDLGPVSPDDNVANMYGAEYENQSKNFCLLITHKMHP